MNRLFMASKSSYPGKFHTALIAPIFQFFINFLLMTIHTAFMSCLKWTEATFNSNVFMI